jgi:hypothetical protein
MREKLKVNSRENYPKSSVLALPVAALTTRSEEPSTQDGPYEASWHRCAIARWLTG